MTDDDLKLNQRGALLDVLVAHGGQTIVAGEQMESLIEEIRVVALTHWAFSPAPPAGTAPEAAP